MGSNDRGRGDTPGTHREPQGSGNPTSGPDAYANWLERMQRARARQAAITRNLYTWSNYKSWADKVRDSWSDSETGTAAHAVSKPNKK